MCAEAPDESIRSVTARLPSAMFLPAFESKRETGHRHVHVAHRLQARRQGGPASAADDGRQLAASDARAGAARRAIPPPSAAGRAVRYRVGVFCGSGAGAGGEDARQGVHRSARLAHDRGQRNSCWWKMPSRRSSREMARATIAWCQARAALDLAARSDVAVRALAARARTLAAMPDDQLSHRSSPARTWRESKSCWPSRRQWARKTAWQPCPTVQYPRKPHGGAHHVLHRRNCRQK
jgi:hypothetical protein